MKTENEAKTKHTPDVLLPLVEQLKLIAKLSHKHEVQSWLDEAGTDTQKLSRIFKMSAGIAGDVAELLEAAKAAYQALQILDPGYGETGSNSSLQKKMLYEAISKAEGK